MLSFENSLYILDSSRLQAKWFANILSHFVICLFIFTCYFTEQKFFILMRSNLSCLQCQVKEFLPSLKPENFSYNFTFSQHHLLKSYLLKLHWVVFVSLSKISRAYWWVCFYILYSVPWTHVSIPCHYSSLYFSLISDI